MDAVLGTHFCSMVDFSAPLLQAKFPVVVMTPKQKQRTRKPKISWNFVRTVWVMLCSCHRRYKIV
jgi:hypothetical protein